MENRELFNKIIVKIYLILWNCTIKKAQMYMLYKVNLFTILKRLNNNSKTKEEASPVQINLLSL